MRIARPLLTALVALGVALAGIAPPQSFWPSLKILILVSRSS